MPWEWQSNSREPALQPWEFYAGSDFGALREEGSSLSPCTQYLREHKRTSLPSDSLIWVLLLR